MTAYDDSRFRDTGGTSSLSGALSVLRERWWIVLGVPAICVAIALAHALTTTKEYEAQARLLFRESNVGSALVGVPELNNTDPQRQTATNLSLITSNTVAGLVRKQLSSTETPSDLAAQIKVKTEPNSDLVDVVATDPDPERAARLADAFANQFVAFRRNTDQETLAQGEEKLRQRIDQLGPDQVTQKTALQRALSTIQSLEVVQTGNAQVVDAATVPDSPAKPRPKLDALLGLLLGLGLGVALAFLIDVLDRRVKSVDDFESLYGMGALASVPEHHNEPRTERERIAQLEPFRILRNGLSFIGMGRARTVLVTSAVSGEGKSTVAAGLAQAIALAGQSVILVEVDLRRPTIARTFDLGSHPRGLTTALVGGVPPADLLRKPLPRVHNFSVLPAGPLPPNAAELLRSAEVSRLLEQLRDLASVIVLDAPPLLPVADAQVLLEHRMIDACLVVGRERHVTRDQVRRTRAILDRHGLEGLGLVVNGVKATEAGYDYYDERNEPEIMSSGTASSGNGSTERTSRTTA